MTYDLRHALAIRQHALLAALVAGGQVPEGFDATRVRLQSTALLAKRRVLGAVEADMPEAVRGHTLDDQRRRISETHELPQL